MVDTGSRDGGALACAPSRRALSAPQTSSAATAKQSFIDVRSFTCTMDTKWHAKEQGCLHDKQLVLCAVPSVVSSLHCACNTWPDGDRPTAAAVTAVLGQKNTDTHVAQDSVTL